APCDSCSARHPLRLSFVLQLLLMNPTKRSSSERRSDCPQILSPHGLNIGKRSLWLGGDCPTTLHELGRDRLAPVRIDQRMEQPGVGRHPRREPSRPVGSAPS